MISAAKAYERLQLALSDARRSEGLTQKEVANKLTRPQSFVSKYEKGERRLDVVEFVAVCHALKVDPVAVLENIMGRR
jgi:transcriptional regulator with XRE-family HTH domain